MIETAPRQPSASPQVESLQLKVGGMSCGFCVSTIDKAYRRLDGVRGVHVSLAHEEALIHYESGRVSPEKLRETLRQIGYTVRDPDKVKAFEEQRAEMRNARNKLIGVGVRLSASRPARGAWIETSPHDLRRTYIGVAPHAGRVGHCAQPSPQQVRRPSVMCISLADPASRPNDSHTVQNQHHGREGPQGQPFAEEQRTEQDCRHGRDIGNQRRARGPGQCQHPEEQQVGQAGAKHPTRRNRRQVLPARRKRKSGFEDQDDWQHCGRSNQTFLALFR